ncbi:MAG: hypothetical protein JWL87_739 [Candidatus Adlerbacteria bacterium]|nr:hypothetical protein [Candidatus Adlerbacteria bacterium]
MRTEALSEFWDKVKFKYRSWERGWKIFLVTAIVFFLALSGVILYCTFSSPKMAAVMASRFIVDNEEMWASATYNGLKSALDEIVRRENETRNKVNDLFKRIEVNTRQIKAIEDRPQSDSKKFEDALKALDKKLEEKVPLSMLKVLEGKFASLEGEVVALKANFPRHPAA